MKAFIRLARPSPACSTLRFPIRSSRTPQFSSPSSSSPRRTFSHTRRRPQNPHQQPQQPADDPNFTSILDNPPQLVRTGRRRHGLGLLVLAVIPVTAFALGTWQVYRLGWKTDLIAKCEDRLYREPLPLPPVVDPDAVAAEFDYRRVVARGRWRHDREMLIGPRVRDGEVGYMVITPLERADGASTVLVNRGWIPKKLGDQRARRRAAGQHGPGGEGAEALPEGEVVVEGLLREPWRKNMFTPENRPDKGEFYFPDVRQMAELTGAQPVWIEATMGKRSPFVIGKKLCLLTTAVQIRIICRSWSTRPRASLLGDLQRST